MRIRNIRAATIFSAVILSASAFSMRDAYADNFGDSATNVTDSAKIESVRNDFEKSLSLLGSGNQLTSCRMMVQLKQDPRDDSFGAICKLGPSGRDIMLCDDTMIGKFTIKASGFSETPEEVAYFTKTNCPGGG